ncbi:cardiolipin synthase A, partial [Candidatus Saccharibacteria bacterium]|nr:cardiolipin synthase A [Candidatus Saccharibacteria bacterium]
TINQAFKELASDSDHTSKTNVAPEYRSMAALAESLTSLPVTAGNSVSLLTDYDEAIADMAQKISRAKRFVYVEFYAMTLDDATEPFFKALQTAAKNGVEVYVLFDTYGSKKYKGYKKMQAFLSAAGIHWAKILPTRLPFRGYNRPDLRNHRKIVTVDGDYAYIGSLNMIDKTYHRKDTISYIELVVRTSGPSVHDLAAVFAGDWFSETDQVLRHFINDSPAQVKDTINLQVVPSGSAYDYPNNLYFMTMLIHSARTSIHITNPYLVPDASLLTALIAAAKRGVHVSILNSEVMDQWMVGNAQRSYYEEILKAGVNIYLYNKPQLVHEKFMVVDDNVAIIGSSNLDIRSFELNMECVLAIYDKATARKLSTHHNKLLKQSTLVSLKKWLQRSYLQSMLESITRLASALQ